MRPIPYRKISDSEPTRMSDTPVEPSIAAVVRLITLVKSRADETSRNQLDHALDILAKLENR